MRRKLILGLVLLNGLFAAALISQPIETQIIPRGLFNCCKDTGPDGYCCFRCCWFIVNCWDDEDCLDPPDPPGGKVSDR